MVGKAYTCSRTGLFCNIVEVEVDLKRGLPNILISGLLSQEVRESRERIQPAIVNSGFDFPMKRITINLSPAELTKTGTHYDLAIAAAILKICGALPEDELKTAYFGELNLSGHVKWIRGILPLVMESLNNNFERIFIPYDNYNEVYFLNSGKIIPIKTINELFNTESLNFNFKPLNENKKENESIYEYSFIMGQPELIESYKIAASGNHHMLLIGPPGSGKTMSASRIPGIMPKLTDDEIIEINKIYSINGFNENKNWINKRPFRSPHHSASQRAMIGGGSNVSPGEISLSHKGILFLDEFLEFRIDTLQALRTVIEKKEVYISLRNGCAVYPADFLLIAAANPCPCGYYNTKEGVCSCSMNDIKKYKKKLRNPLIDRIDLQVKVERINYKDLTDAKQGQSTYIIKEDVLYVRNIQKERYKKEIFSLNSEIPPEKISYYCEVEKEVDKILEEYTENNLLTARSCHKILKIARTIADIKKKDKIMEDDIKDALKFRFLDVENY